MIPTLSPEEIAQWRDLLHKNPVVARVLQVINAEAPPAFNPGQKTDSKRFESVALDSAYSQAWHDAFTRLWNLSPGTQQPPDAGFMEMDEPETVREKT